MGELFQDSRNVLTVAFFKDEWPNLSIRARIGIEVVADKGCLPGDPEPDIGTLCAIKSISEFHAAAREDTIALDDLPLAPAMPALLRATDSGNIAVVNDSESNAAQPTNQRGYPSFVCFIIVAVTDKDFR